MTSIITRAPLHWGGGILPPCLTPERMIVETRKTGKRRTKALKKTNLKNTKHIT